MVYPHLHRALLVFIIGNILFPSLIKGQCKDNLNTFLVNGVLRTCAWIQTNNQCSLPEAQANCPVTCNMCSRTRKPTQKPSRRPTKKPSRRPTKKPTRRPTRKPTIPTNDSVWGGIVKKITSWNGYVEVAQTHVIKAVGEARHAPKVIGDREAEILFSPTMTAQPTPIPTLAPTSPISFKWGLELLPTTTLNVTTLNGTKWPTGYPMNSNILLENETEYYVPNSIPAIDINFDLASQNFVQGVYIKTWYVTEIAGIRVGVRPFAANASGWTWFNIEPVTQGYNSERIAIIPKLAVRYVKIRLTGCSSSYGSDWGLRRVMISGLADRPVLQSSYSMSTPATGSSGSYFPSSSADVRLVAYDKTGALLGTMKLRSPGHSRPILEQSLTSTPLAPYSTIAWSATLPWNWVREDTELLIGSFDASNVTNLFMHRLVLKGVISFAEHTLVRTKVLIFGNESDAQKLNTFTYEGGDLAKGMFNAMPIASMHWVDSEDWHLPYLVTPTLAGPRRVYNENDRRTAISAAGGDPGVEPGWDILKDQFALRHNLANTGRGFTVTDGGGDDSPYSSGTSIFMGWALVQQVSGEWYWEQLGYWSGWTAAAWTGWCGMVPGDECGNTLIHELGHSQTMAHFTTGASASWGIADEYPNDGVNEPWHPWGYDTTSRRFRTWYEHYDIASGKYDPMNGGEPSNAETCFPQYTGYHSQKSQLWGSQAPILLSGMVPGVKDGDGAYKFDYVTSTYKKIPDQDINSVVHSSALPPIEVGVPVLTFIGTLGSNAKTCQTYPPIRGSAGNTFKLPDPFDRTLNGYYFNGAKYMVEISYNDTSVDRGLIAVPDLSGSTSIRYYSFTVAMRRRPLKVRLYKFTRAAYPNISVNSTRTLLHTRLVDPLPSLDVLEGIPSTYHVGRGWLGDSRDVVLDALCLTNNDCASKPKKLLWRGSDGASYTFSSSYSAVQTIGNSSIFTIRVRRDEDGSMFDLKIAASRFVKENGLVYYPLLAPLPVLNTSIAPDESHGVVFTAPYSLNAKLAKGTYSSINTLYVSMKSNGGNTDFTTIRVSVFIKLLTPTNLVDISPGKTFSSKLIYSTAPSESSVYFLAKDPAVGPTSRIWWGDWDGWTKLSIPLYSECLGGFTTGSRVIAVVKAQQYSCGSRWEMEAGREANACGHSLELNLGDISMNPWLGKVSKNCTLVSDPNNPIVIEARRWHEPLETKLLYGFVLDVKVNL